ncbi:MAG: sulfotransferase, partial [Anaerolineales bacterium]|nr:sulfotransferase [Anaerolineales bacterium]
YKDVVDAYHHVTATTVDEEVNLMRDCLWNNIGVTYVGENEAYPQWVLDKSQEKRYMYRYIKVWVQLMSSTYQPDSHWVLKTPSHSYFLPTVEEEFPDANLVFIHRDPTNVVASACQLNLVAGLSRVDYHKLDPARHGERVMHFLKVGTDLIREFQEAGSPAAQRAFHIRYEELTGDPIGSVERMYDHFGYEMTDEFRGKMAEHLGQNRQYKHGKPTYSLEQFGLSKEKVRAAFAEYTETFRPEPVAPSVNGQ